MRTTARTDADERATTAHHGFPGFKTDLTDCSVTEITPSSTSPDNALWYGTPVESGARNFPRSFTKRSSGLVGLGVVRGAEQIRGIRSIREIRDEAVVVL